MTATTDDYRTGKVVEGIRKAEMVLGDREEFAAGDPVFERIREKIVAFRPVWITAEQALELIRRAKSVAVGERVCRALHPESPETQTVFLDELADAMAGAGKAEIVTAVEAEQVVNRQARHRIIASMVSGNYFELCAAHPPDCVFCRAERAGVRCIEAHQDFQI